MLLDTASLRLALTQLKCPVLLMLLPAGAPATAGTDVHPAAAPAVQSDPHTTTSAQVGGAAAVQPVAGAAGAATAVQTAAATAANVQPQLATATQVGGQTIVQPVAGGTVAVQPVVGGTTAVQPVVGETVQADPQTVVQGGTSAASQENVAYTNTAATSEQTMATGDSVTATVQPATLSTSPDSATVGSATLRAGGTAYNIALTSGDVPPATITVGEPHAHSVDVMQCSIPLEGQHPYAVCAC